MMYYYYCRQHVNDLALYIDLEEALSKAEGIFIQLKDSPSIGLEVRRILGLREMSESSEDSPSSNRSPISEFSM
jgi:hypothetical protein